MPGQHKALDTSKLDAVCNLVAAGVSIRQAARFMDCDPKSIRRERARNDEFRRRLDKAKSAASIRPIQTLLAATQDNWRAALCWMERVDPDRFARPDATVVTKREANRFVADLIAAIEKAIKKPNQRKRLFRLLTPAMPTAMRRNWEMIARRRAAEDFDRRQAERDEKRRRQRRARDNRRSRLWSEIGDWLPWELYKKLQANEDLLDPEEVFGQTPGDSRTPDELIDDALADVPRHYKPGSMKSEQYVARHSESEPYYSWEQWCALSQEERKRISSERARKRRLLEAALWPAAPSPEDAAADDPTPADPTKGASLGTIEASPATNDGTPPGRLPDDSASPPTAEPKPPNDLPFSGEAPSPAEGLATKEKNFPGGNPSEAPCSPIPVEDSPWRAPRSRFSAPSPVQFRGLGLPYLK